MCIGHCRDRINTAITTLELGDNRIGDAGAAALADALRCACISGMRGVAVFAVLGLFSLCSAIIDIGSGIYICFAVMASSVTD